MRKYYTEQTMESIARRVLDAYDTHLYRGQPRAIPIEDIIERHGLTLEFQYLRKNGRILGKTVFDTGLEAVYDMELGEYTLFPVKAGTILIDASLCEEETSTGRLRVYRGPRTVPLDPAQGAVCGHRGERGAAACRQGNQYGDPGEYARVRPAHAHANGQAVFLPNAVRPG